MMTAVTVGFKVSPLPPARVRTSGAQLVLRFLRISCNIRNSAVC